MVVAGTPICWNTAPSVWPLRISTVCHCCWGAEASPDAGIGGSGRAIDICAECERVVGRSPKPGTIAAVSAAMVASRLACAHCRLDHRPVNPWV